MGNLTPGARSIPVEPAVVATVLPVLMIGIEKVMTGLPPDPRCAPTNGGTTTDVPVGALRLPTNDVPANRVLGYDV